MDIEYIPSEKEQSVVSDVFSRFRMASDERNLTYAYFDGSNLIDYINDSVRRFVTNIDAREGIEDWQAIVHDPFTRNKVKAVLGKIFSVLPAVEIHGRGSEDFRKGALLTALYDYSDELDDYEEFMVNFLLEAIVKGTAIGYESVDVKTRKIRDVKGANDNITEKITKEKTTHIYSAIVPLEDFYPSSVGTRSIKQMPYCFWRNVIPYSQFVQDFSQYKKHTVVSPNKRTSGDNEVKPFYKDYISKDVQEGEVEIIRFFDKTNDEYVIMANGIWLNPVGDKEVISPLPHNHKELPFYEAKFDHFGSDFFYGKSLPDTLKTTQDVLNVLENMLLDQSFLSIWAPILVAGGQDPIEDDYLRPGRRITVDTQGLPLNQMFMKLDPGTPGGWHQFILEYTRRIMEESSVDQVAQGVAGVGERTTAQEIRVAAEAINSILGIFGGMVKSAMKRRANLRVKNIMQFWTSSKTPLLQVLTPEGVKELNEAFNVFKIDGVQLTNGKRGMKIIEIYKNKTQLPGVKELKTRGMIESTIANKPVEIDAILPSYIRNVEVDIKLVPNIKREATREIIQAMQLEKVRVYQTFFPDLIDREELAAETMEKMGDDPTKLLRLNTEMPDISAERDAGTSAVPTQNVAENMVRGAGGKSPDLAQLAQSMLG